MNRHGARHHLLNSGKPDSSDIAVVCTLGEVITNAVAAVINQTADSHIFKEDELLTAYGYEHAIAEERCWCDPVIVYTDPVTCHKVYLHRTLEA